MKTFKQYINEEKPEDEGDLSNVYPYNDPANWIDGAYHDWCKEHPDHEDCEEWRKKQKGGKK
jgi:hypothetical protein